MGKIRHDEGGLATEAQSRDLGIGESGASQSDIPEFCSEVRVERGEDVMLFVPGLR